MSLPTGTRVTVSPGATFTSGESLESVLPEIYKEEYLEVGQPPDEDRDYNLVTSKGYNYYVNEKFVHEYKEPAAVSNTHYEYTIEDFERFAELFSYTDVLNRFKRIVESSKPKSGEVWVVEYEGGTDYARKYGSSWYTSDGDALHNGDIVPVKKVGVDENE